MHYCYTNFTTTESVELPMISLKITSQIESSLLTLIMPIHPLQKLFQECLKAPFLDPHYFFFILMIFIISPFQSRYYMLMTSLCCTLTKIYIHSQECKL